MILHKLRKLDIVETRLDNLDKSMASLEESFAVMEKDVQNLKDKTAKTNPKERTGKMPRPIIARFLRYSDREQVLLCAKTSLKGKDYGVFEDMRKELYQLRKAQMKKLQSASRQGSIAYFSRKYQDKLFIDGYCIPLEIDLILIVLSFFQYACELVWNFFPLLCIRRYIIFWQGLVSPCARFLQ